MLVVFCQTNLVRVAVFSDYQGGSVFQAIEVLDNQLLLAVEIGFNELDVLPVGRVRQAAALHLGRAHIPNFDLFSGLFLIVEHGAFVGRGAPDLFKSPRSVIFFAHDPIVR